MCWFFSGMLRSFVTTLCSPNEDFGRRNKRWNPDFRSTFQWFVAQIEYSHPWKVPRKSGFHLLFLLPKSSFGRGKLYAHPNEDFGRRNKRWNACSLNEDFGSPKLTPNQPFRMCVRNNFQRFVAQIEYSRPWKVLRRHIRKGWFGLPKSSFGRGTMRIFEALFHG